MRVLVTRPEEKAARTCRRLEALGHQPFRLPLFRPVHCDDAARKAVATNQWAALAVTSGEALHDLRAKRDAPAMKDRPIFAVGEATAEIARGAGFTDVIAGKGNGQALAETIAAVSGGLEAPLLYLAGEPRAPSFERALEANGIAFETVTVYVMQPVDYARNFVETALRQAMPDAVMLYSVASARRFFELGSVEMLYNLNLSPEFLCMSETVANDVPEALSALVRIAKTPDEESLLRLLT